MFDKPSDYPRTDYRSRNYPGVWQKQFIDDYLKTISNKGLEPAIAEMADYKKEHLPKNLYKFYRPTSYSLATLESDELWLSNPRLFNDPFDSYACIEKLTFEKEFLLNKLAKMELIKDEVGPDNLSHSEKSEIKSSFSKEEVDRTVIYSSNRRYYNGVLRDILSTKTKNFKTVVQNIESDARHSFRKAVDNIRNTDVSVSCFAAFDNIEELGKNTTMWSHYADNHTGFCIKYCFDDAEDFVKTGLFPVKYTSRVPQLSIKQILKSIDNNQKLTSNHSIAKTSRKALIAKSALWNYEKEWRLIVENERVDLFNNGSVPFPYATSIYMGCRIDPALKTHLVTLAQRKKLEVFETYQNDERFVLDIRSTNINKLKEDAVWNELRALRHTDEDSIDTKLLRERILKKLDPPIVRSVNTNH